MTTAYINARERVFALMNAMSSEQRVALIQEIIRKYENDINPYVKNKI